MYLRNEKFYLQYEYHLGCVHVAFFFICQKSTGRALGRASSKKRSHSACQFYFWQQYLGHILTCHHFHVWLVAWKQARVWLVAWKEETLTTAPFCNVQKFSTQSAHSSHTKMADKRSEIKGADYSPFPLGRACGNMCSLLIGNNYGRKRSKKKNPHYVGTYPD